MLFTKWVIYTVGRINKVRVIKQIPISVEEESQS